MEVRKRTVPADCEGASDKVVCLEFWKVSVVLEAFAAPATSTKVEEAPHAIPTAVPLVKAAGSMVMVLEETWVVLVTTAKTVPLKLLISGKLF
ncbi:MAG: hypothetical protein EBU61_04165 [Crocinitomicaceae bacterium]|nr:hypothetical protein [Crocinitomicaceae bacterium]